MNKFEKARERELFRRLADGSLTAEEFSAVEQRLLSDAGFRDRYIRAIDIEAGLYEAFNFPGTFRAPVARKRSSLAIFAIGSLCATVLLGLAGWLYWTDSWTTDASVPIATLQHPGAEYGAALSREQRPVAIVTQVHQAANNAATGFRPGMRIKPGVLTVESGQVQLEFLNGAQINVEGPAQLRIVSVDEATLISGKAAAHVPPGARGFVLNTPDAAIVDLGTQFAVSVGKQGESEVHVLDGEVDVSLLGNDGNTLTSQRLTEAKSLRVNRLPAGLERIDAPSVTFPGILAQTSAPLQVNDAYVRSIRASDPAIYWRFEKLVDGRVPNEMGPRWSGRIHADPGDPSAIVVRDGMVRFTPSDNPRRLEADESIPGLNQESFTVEFWASPDYFHWATLVAVVPEEEAVRNLHLCLIELPHKCSLVYSPGSFRLLNRHPPGDVGGTNLFSDSDCTPGLWHHIAAIKSPAGMKLYLNGRLIRHFAETTTGDSAPYRVLVGQLYEGFAARQLSGAIDEFAVYLRALDDEEISEHYRAMMADRPSN